ncbi:MAG: DNA polymerase III subunit alpha [Gemmatimonadaceae bacterium]
MYTELRAHTGFSLGDGATTPESLVMHARQLGYSSIGITDTADLGAVPRFVTEARTIAKDPACRLAAKHTEEPCRICERPVRPIVGAELNVEGYPAAFLVRERQGCRNLAALITCARVGTWSDWDKAVQGKRRGRPQLTWQQIADRSDGLHALTGPASGQIASLLHAGDTAAADRALRRWRDIFGERLAIEVQLHHASTAESALAGALIDLADLHGVPWVVAHDPRYLDDTGRLVHDMLTALRQEMDLATAAERGVLRPNGEWRLISPAQMVRRWRGREEGLHESDRIAEECEFDLAWMRPPLPYYPVPQRHTDDSYLREQTYAGARERWGEVLSDAQISQIEHELAVIKQLGFAGFFLVMWDAMQFARSRGILSQGRGSAANSAVAYCLGITAVDPVRHGLLFERFLSEIRAEGGAEAPDIDVDIEHDRREEVLDYVYDRYDRSHAAIACIVQTYRAPNAAQDAMRALGYPPEMMFAVSKRVHNHEPAAGAEYIRESVAARAGLDITDTRGRTLLAAMAGFEGLPRLRATHVGGFVLSSAPLGDYLPIEQTTMGRTIVQFDKDDLDAIGAPKFDFLGLGALSQVRRAFDVIERRTGTRPQLYRIPPDDRKSYDLIARGETIGMFQIESRAQIASILHTRPAYMYDIVVQIALIRPGPIQARFVHPYTQRRLGLEPVEYAHPALEPILKRTQGIPIFQEQAMAIAMALANYTGSEADELRRTMGNQRKKDRLLRALQRLASRLVENNVEERVASRICEDLQSFANYGFPESHAWSFALIAYATAWLKAHYPAEFYAGLLNSWPMGFYPVSTLIHDARRHGVEVRPACLCHGDWECAVEEADRFDRPAMRIGWRHIRGVGTKLLDALRASRAESPWTSIEGVVRRTRLTRADALALARAGAFTAWEPDRRRAAWEALRAVGDVLPLAPAHVTLHHPPPMDTMQLVFLDYTTTGASIHGHPMEAVRQKLRRWGALDSRDLEHARSGARIIVGGLVTVRQRPETANGTIFLLLEDEHGFINVIVPRQLVEANADVIKSSTFILVLGRFERDGQVMNVVGQKFATLEVGELIHRSHDFH